MSTAPGPGILRDHDERFRQLFERSADAISLFDPRLGVFVESNDAAARLIGAPDKAALANLELAQVAPVRQPDGQLSAEKAAEMIRLAIERGSHRFEWLARRLDGSDMPTDVVLTLIESGEPPMLLTVSRDISEHKQAERRIQDLNLDLERRVLERTADLVETNHKLQSEIRERLHQERLLQESEARARTLLDNAPEAIVVFDGESGRFESVNKNAVRLFGRTQEELLTMSPTDVSAPVQSGGRPSGELAREKIAEALAGGTPVFPWLHRHSNGRTFPSEVRLVRLPGVDRCLIRASITNDTERHRREQIQSATYRLSEAVHTAEDLDALYARIHRIVGDMMPAKNFYIALREPADDVFSFVYFRDEKDAPPKPARLGEGLTSHVFRSARPLLVNAATPMEHLPGGVARLCEDGTPLVHRELGTTSAVWLGVPLVIRGATVGVMAVQDYENPQAYGDAEKQMLAFVAEQTALAIDRKRAEQAMRESEAKHRALFEATSQGVMLHDEERFLEVNPAALRIMGYSSANEIVGKHPVDTSPPLQPCGERSETLAQQHIRQCMDTGNVRFDWLTLTRDGRQIPLEVILTRIPMGGRQIIQAVINDISERKRLEEELHRALAREKELSQLKTNFVSTVSHEFRTPLGIIMSSAQILADYLDQLEPVERLQHLNSITRNTRQMATLMEEVLLLSRVDSGRMIFEPGPLDLPGLCRRLTDEILSATGRQCPIHLSVTPDCGDVRADERLLRHILTNLLSNAVKYSARCSPIEFTAERRESDLVCRIADRGIGIPDEDREWLFTAFHRGRNVGERQGSGLGLTIVKRCVELHGGRIEVARNSGSGTAVTVWLPVWETLSRSRPHSPS
jgi:PAS domain S-box-containing protein